MAVTRTILVVVAVALALVLSASPSCEANRKILSTGRKLLGTDPGINADDPTWYYVERQVRVFSFVFDMRLYHGIASPPKE